MPHDPSAAPAHREQGRVSSSTTPLPRPQLPLSVPFFHCTINREWCPVRVRAHQPFLTPGGARPGHPAQDRTLLYGLQQCPEFFIDLRALRHSFSLSTWQAVSWSQFSICQVLFSLLWTTATQLKHKEPGWHRSARRAGENESQDSAESSQFWLDHSTGITGTQSKSAPRKSFTFQPYFRCDVSLVVSLVQTKVRSCSQFLSRLLCQLAGRGSSEGNDGGFKRGRRTKARGRANLLARSVRKEGHLPSLSLLRQASTPYQVLRSHQVFSFPKVDQRRRQRLKIRRERSLYETAWMGYIARLRDLLQQQFKHRTEILEAFASAEAAWLATLQETGEAFQKAKKERKISMPPSQSTATWRMRTKRTW